MFGAIAGDIIGSVFEGHPVKSKDFCLFSPASRYTDDTVLTLAVGEALLADRDYASNFRAFYRMFPDRDYGEGFRRWADSPEGRPCYSYGNGSAMRAGPIGWAFAALPEVLHEARHCAAVTHNHAEGIKGAQAVAAAVYLARKSYPKSAIKSYISNTFGYDLDRTLDQIRPDYAFDVSCAGSVPESIIAFLESCDFEDAVRNAISLGGDSDTLACMAGGIAQAYYRKIPEYIAVETNKRLDNDLRQIVELFNEKYGLR